MFPGFLIPVLTKLFFPKPLTTFLKRITAERWKKIIMKKAYRKEKNKIILASHHQSKYQTCNRKSLHFTTAFYFECQCKKWTCNILTGNQPVVFVASLQMHFKMITFRGIKMSGRSFLWTLKENPWLDGGQFTLYHIILTFNKSWKRNLLKTLWEKEKMLITSIFSQTVNLIFSS